MLCCDHIDHTTFQFNMSCILALAILFYVLKEKMAISPIQEH